MENRNQQNKQGQNQQNQQQNNKQQNQQENKAQNKRNKLNEEEASPAARRVHIRSPCVILQGLFVIATADFL